MNYCFGCQKYFVKATYEGGAFVVLAFSSKEAALINAYRLIDGFKGVGRFYVTIVNRKGEVVCKVTDLEGNFIGKWRDGYDKEPKGNSAKGADDDGA